MCSTASTNESDRFLTLRAPLTSLAILLSERKLELAKLFTKFVCVDIIVFVYKARWFVLSQTDGQELEPVTVPGVGRRKWRMKAFRYQRLLI